MPKRERVAALLGPLPPEQRLRLYAFPFPLPGALGADGEVIDEWLAAGFVTVIRRPLKCGYTQQAVLAHARSIVSPQLLLFLDAHPLAIASAPAGSA